MNTPAQNINPNFFIIKVVAPGGKIGFVIRDNEGIKISDMPVADMKTFPNAANARTFIKLNSIERNGIRASVISNHDVMKEDFETVATVNGTMYYLENEAGEKICYSAEERGYYFEAKEYEYCMWNTKKKLQDFIAAMQFPEPVFIRELSPKPKIIQVVK